MTYFISLILSLFIILVISLIFRDEASFWLEKTFGRFKKRKIKKLEVRPEDVKPIKKYCGFRDWSDQGGEKCTLFLLEDDSEYLVTEEICKRCSVWDRYEEWLKDDKKERLSVTLTHTLKGSRPMVVETDNLNPEAEKGLSFNDFVIKRRRIKWAGKAAIAFLTLTTYLIVYFSGIFYEPIVQAMPDTWYFYDVGGKAVSGSWNMRTTDPSSSADTTTKCTNASSLDDTKNCHLKPGVNNSTWEANYSGPKKKGWMTDDDSLLDGTIASGTWTVYIKYNWTINNVFCSYDLVRLQWKLWKADSNLDNETVIMDWNNLCSVSTGTNTCTDTTSPGSVTLSNEVLHVEFRVYLDLGSCISGDPDAVLTFYVDEGGSTEKLNSPTYTPVPENSLYLAFLVPFIPLIIKRFKTKDKDLK